jgi:hypothetical protein
MAPIELPSNQDWIIIESTVRFYCAHWQTGRSNLVCCFEEKITSPRIARATCQRKVEGLV